LNKYSFVQIDITDQQHTMLTFLHATSSTAALHIQLCWYVRCRISQKVTLWQNYLNSPTIV